jgi:hypothetical protein
MIQIRKLLTVTEEIVTDGGRAASAHRRPYQRRGDEGRRPPMKTYYLLEVLPRVATKAGR